MFNRLSSVAGVTPDILTEVRVQFLLLTFSASCQRRTATNGQTTDRKKTRYNSGKRTVIINDFLVMVDPLNGTVFSCIHLKQAN